MTPVTCQHPSLTRMAVFRLQGLAAIVQSRAGLKTDRTDDCEAWLWPMWAFMPSQVWLFLHTTTYPVAPPPRQDPPVSIMSLGQAFSAAALASASSSCSNSASRVSASTSRTMFSVGPLWVRAFVSLRPIPVRASTTYRAWSPCGRLSSRITNRRCLFSSCAVAALRLDSIERASRLVVLKQPVVALAFWLTSSCSSSV